MKKFITHLFSVIAILSATFLIASEPEVKERDGAWFLNTTDTTESGNPSDLKYFKFYDVMPDEVTLEIFKDKNLTNIGEKKLHIGYGISDPKGENCSVFKAEMTENGVETKVCLPWWRKEIEYITKKNIINDVSSVLDNLQTPRPPLLVNVCSKWSTPKEYQGGKTVCTSYYDKLAGGDCWDNPEQSKCFVNNCGSYIENDCTYIDSTSGETEVLKTAIDDDFGVPIEADTKYGLVSHQYNCPSGPINEPQCEEEKNALMFPYECKPDDPSISGDSGEYAYCDEKKPIYNDEGVITGFDGFCSDNTPIICKANSFTNTTSVCSEPIYETYTDVKTYETKLTRTYTSHVVDVLSGEPDMYSGQEQCLRANTVEDAREQELYVKIVGNGSLDDDIYVLRHKADGEHAKIYCNMQHNQNAGSRKSYNGEVLECISNNGNYSFNQEVPINTSDIVTVQQNSENENANGTPFSLGRNHYVSTSLSIDGIQVAPSTFPSDFPYYPSSGYLKTWDNTTSTFSILFPFAGAYEIFFYNKNGEEMGTESLNVDDFKSIAEHGSMQMKLGRNMKLANNVKDDVLNEQGQIITTNANREDAWVEWGGGVFGGKGSKTGIASSVPNDNYVKENSVTRILIKDLLTGAIIPIEMVYPLPYPNRIYVSKLKVYEHRKYRCYEEFPAFSAPTSNEKETFVCSKNPIWQDYKNGLRQDIDGLQQWGDTAMCGQNCRDYNTCVPKTENSNNGFMCEQRVGADIGGDLSGNLFSDKTQCDSVCYAQSSCVSYIQNDCELVNESLSRPVSDLTGKTIYKQKDIAFTCTNKTEKQTGCAKYDVKVIEGEVNYDFSAIGWETKDFSAQFEKSLTQANMLDVGSQHIWSGWKGKCVTGMKMDSSYLSDPMTIATYAVSAYSSYTQINGTSLYDQATENFGETITTDTAGKAAMTEGGKSTTQATTSATTTTTTTTTANEGFAEASYAKAEAWWNTEQVANQGYGFQAITNGDLVSLGASSVMELLAPNQDQFMLAEKLLNPFANDDDASVQAYNSCMSSIGLSFPSIMSYTFDEPEGASDELREPWKHPLRITTTQLETLSTAMSEAFVIKNYMYSSEDNMLINLIALNGPAYIKTGQIICAGYKVSQAMDYINIKKGKELPNMSSGNGAAAANIALSAVSMWNPALGFAMRIAMDLYTNMLTKIDSCTDEKDALARGMKEFKTLKFKTQDQCVLIDTYCDKKANYGIKKKCVRQGYDFCCYDKITTKVFAEGLKEQLNQDWSSCVGITVNDLKDISFRECNEGEVPSINKCFSTSKYSEYQKVLFRQGSRGMDVEGLTKQVTNAMSN